MKTVLFFLSAAILVALISCNSNQNKKTEPEVYSEYIETGNEVSGKAQGILMANVSSAMQKGGPGYAIEFCNLEASSLIDSLSEANNCTISRVSQKNRNPGNALKNEKEKQLWNFYAAKLENGSASDTLIRHGKTLVYYKPIKTAMPACLKCHGTPGEDIQPATYATIQELYPNDKATGYDLNEFRGLWKIQFDSN
ncbi:MAG: c-type heme family protein [Prolixibacteraceae bacterium]